MTCLKCKQCKDDGGDETEECEYPNGRCYTVAVESNEHHGEFHGRGCMNPWGRLDANDCRELDYGVFITSHHLYKTLF